MITLNDAKAQLNITGNQVDEELQGYIDASTGVVERYTGQSMQAVQHTDVTDAAGSDRLALDHWPVTSLISVTDGRGAWDLTNVLVESRSVLRSKGRPFTGWVTVEYEAGYAEVPASYRLAALIIVQHLWETQRGTMMGVAQAGGLDTTVEVQGMGFAIPNRALELMGAPLPGIA